MHAGARFVLGNFDECAAGLTSVRGVSERSLRSELQRASRRGGPWGASSSERLEGAVPELVEGVHESPLSRRCVHIATAAA